MSKLNPELRSSSTHALAISFLCLNSTNRISIRDYFFSIELSGITTQIEWDGSPLTFACGLTSKLSTYIDANNIIKGLLELAISQETQELAATELKNCIANNF
jgi:hypothetical protein